MLILPAIDWTAVGALATILALILQVSLSLSKKIKIVSTVSKKS
jgi:hypothetical protein